MSTFRQQLFHQFASQGLAASIEAFNAQYQPKKENRFNFEGITYEIGPARLSEDSITFEISSKIPQDELDDRDDFASYFAAIQDFLKHDTKQPEAADMESIVQEIGAEETKERDGSEQHQRHFVSRRDSRNRRSARSGGVSVTTNE